VRDLPSLNQLAVTFFPENSVGRSFRFQIKVWTTQREALSAVNFIELASIPGKPSVIPQIVSEETSDTQIKVTYLEAPDDGGSPIISYELVMDDGKTGNFTSLVGYKVNSML
jgi:hypothetical protein